MPDGRNASLADPAQFKDVPQAYNAIVAAHEEFKYTLPKIAALTDDPTRTLPELHHVGRQFANRTGEVLNKTYNTLSNAAAEANTEANEIIDNSFAADPDRASIQSEIRSWIRESARTEGGMATLRKAVETNAEVAAVVFHSPDFLLGIGEATRQNLAFDGVVEHLPAATALKARSAALTKAASAYPQLIKSVHASFYNAGLADQMARRVEA